MLGLGWTEMLVIGVVALIFIGPKDLPVVMGRIGKIMGQIRRMGNEFQREINRTTGLDEVRNLRNSITAPLKKSADEIRKEFNTMTPTGPQPSGAIKPADPKSESVVDELRTAAGMPAAKKTNDEIAAESGFKPAKPAPTTPVKAADTPKPVPVEDVADVEPKKPVKASTAKSTASKGVASKKPAATRAKADKPVADETPTEAASAKPARRSRAKDKTAAADTPVAKKPRASRKKADEAADTK